MQRHRITLVVTVLAAVSACAPAAAPWTLDLVVASERVEPVRETEEVDFGTTAARAALGRGWGRRDRDDDGVTAVRMVAPRASVRLAVVDPVDRAITVRLRPVGLRLTESRDVEIRVNGTELGEVRLRRGYRSYRVGVPDELWKASGNEVEFSFEGIDTSEDLADSPGILFDTLVLEGGPLGSLPEASGTPIFSHRDGAIDLPVGVRLDYYLNVPAGAALRLDEVATAGDAATPDGRVVVELERRGAPARALAALAAGSGASTVPLELDARSIVRLSLRTVAPRADQSMRVVRPRLVAEPAAADSSTDGTESGSRSAGSDRGSVPTSPYESPRQAPSLLLYVIDTLSARHLGVYGYERETSPNIDAFAADAIVYEQAFAQSSWTKTSMSSIFTGLLPRSHGVMGRDSVLPSAAETLAEMLRDGGYRTGAAVTITTASALFGFDQGFDEFRELLETDTIELHQRADRLNAFAAEWLEAPSDSPFFLYLHASDPHTPYTPPNPFRERLAPGVDLDDPAAHRTDLRGWEPADDRELRWFNNASRALYDAEIAYVDAQFGALLEELRDGGLYDEMAIVLVADHGEVFGSHGQYTHGTSLFEDVLHVPLLVKLPGGWGAGARVAGRVQQVDVLPTVLTALGRPIPDDVDGRDLLATVIDGVPADAVTTAVLQLGASDLESVTAAGYKLIVDGSAPRRPPRHFLYDLRQDPGETLNTWGTDPVLEGFLLAELRRVRRRGADVVTEETQLDPDVEARLRALGYIQ